MYKLASKSQTVILVFLCFGIYYFHVVMYLIITWDSSAYFPFATLVAHHAKKKEKIWSVKIYIIIVIIIIVKLHHNKILISYSKNFFTRAIKKIAEGLKILKLESVLGPFRIITWALRRHFQEKKCFQDFQKRIGKLFVQDTIRSPALDRGSTRKPSPSSPMILWFWLWRSAKVSHLNNQGRKELKFKPLVKTYIYF